MPKEIFKPYQYPEYKKYLTGPIKQIRVLESTNSHITIAYWILPTSDNESHICDDCKGRASYMLYDMDHMSQTNINLYCQTHAHESFSKWLSEAG